VSCSSSSSRSLRTAWDSYHYDLVPVEEELERRSWRVVEREMHLRKIYHLRDGARVEVVRPMHRSG